MVLFLIHNLENKLGIRPRTIHVCTEGMALAHVYLLAVSYAGPPPADPNHRMIAKNFLLCFNS